jgi:hypothetical protein
MLNVVHILHTSPHSLVQAEDRNESRMNYTQTVLEETKIKS